MGIRRARTEFLTLRLPGEEQSIWFKFQTPGIGNLFDYNAEQGGTTEKERFESVVAAKIKLACSLLLDMEPGKLDYEETGRDGVFWPLDSTVPGWKDYLVLRFNTVLLVIAKKILERHWELPQEVGASEVNFTMPSVSSGKATSEVAPTVPNGKVSSEPGPAPNAGT